VRRRRIGHVYRLLRKSFPALAVAVDALDILCTQDSANPIKRQSLLLLHLRRGRPTSLGSQQNAGVQMEHLSGTARQRAAHLQHLTPGIDAGQQAALPQPVAKTLLTYQETLGPRQLLRDLVASRRLQV